VTPTMSHWPFVAASYALGVLIPLGFGIAAFTRMGTARRRLALIDPRVHRPGVNRPTASSPVAGSSRAGSSRAGSPTPRTQGDT
jgi:hypothetical protein